MNAQRQIPKQYSQNHYGSARYDGNAVRKTELPQHSQNVRFKSRPNKQKQLSKAQSAKKRAARVRARLAVLFSILFVATAAFAVLCRGVMITESTNRLEKKRKELSDMVSTNQRMEMEIEHSLDLKTVEDAATERLGMRQPEKYQTVYVNLEQVDHVEKIKGSSPGEENKLLAAFGKVKEYLE